MGDDEEDGFLDTQQTKAGAEMTFKEVFANDSVLNIDQDKQVYDISHDLTGNVFAQENLF
jgi:hypothetical protein